MVTKSKKQEGFTLIELLVVIAIIAVLSSIVISAVNVARKKAKSAATQGSLRKLQDVMLVAAGDSGKALGNITPINSQGTANWTGQMCLSYTGGPVRDLRNSTGQCYTDWVAAINAITLAASTSMPMKASEFYRDQWGSPYYLDENEGSYGDCRVFDALVSPGPDGILNDPVNPSYPATTDDIKYNLPTNYTIC